MITTSPGRSGFGISVCLSTSRLPKLLSTTVRIIWRLPFSRTIAGPVGSPSMAGIAASAGAVSAADFSLPCSGLGRDQRATPRTVVVEE